MIHSIASPFEQSPATGSLCLILDRSVDDALLTHLFQVEESSRPQCMPLLTNTPYADLQSAGPYVVVYPGRRTPTEYVKNLLEKSDAGCLAWLPANQAMEKAVQHCQSLLTVSADDSPEQMMRFFEPRWLEPLLLSLSEAERCQFIGPFTGLAWRNEIGWRYCAQSAQAGDIGLQPPAWLHVGADRVAHIEQARLGVIATRLANDYSEMLPAESTVESVHRQLLAAQQAGYTRVGDQERWIRLVITRGDTFWENGPEAQLLARDEVPLGERLTQLENL
ncbi:DUF4123 domain-containing protein [Pseudomonas sp. SDO528_S397]